LYALANEIWNTTIAGGTREQLTQMVHSAVQEMAQLVRSYASDEATLTALLDPQRNWYAKPGHKFFLFQYELSLLGNRAPAFTFDDFLGAKRTQTTEHVLPQNPGPSGWGQFGEQARARLTHSLGNLVLTFDNGAYSNHSFTRKRDGDKTNPQLACYRTSVLLQEREFAVLDEWNQSSLLARQERLATWAMVRWALPAVEPGAVSLVLDDEALTDATDVEESAVDQVV
jgi:hypothetical protein